MKLSRLMTRAWVCGYMGTLGAFTALSMIGVWLAAKPRPAVPPSPRA